MSVSRPFFALVSLMLCHSLMAQTRMVAHISKESGGFTPEIILANSDLNDLEYRLTPYVADGTAGEEVAGSIQAGTTQYLSVPDLFGNTDVSHFVIADMVGLNVNISYQSTRPSSSPVHVQESSIQSYSWRIYPGRWEVVWDGLAIVNTGQKATDVVIQQQAADGSELATFTQPAMASMAKMLLVLPDQFQNIAGSHFVIMAGQKLAMVSLRGTYGWSDVQYLWENSPILVDLDQHAAIAEYKGAPTCLGCHAGQETHVMESSHYRFTDSLEQGYIFDHSGNPVQRDFTGKFWKLCGFPTALPSQNWLGRLKDDPTTPHIDKPGGCARCHVGIGIVPNEMKGMTTPSDIEKSLNVDCLICHAANYNRKYYVATQDGEPELNSSGSPIVFSVPRVDGTYDFSGLTTAAQSVGKTSTATCARCHAKSGGGGAEIDGAMHSFKRGDAFAPNTDVHAAAGISCAACHYDQDHKFKRGKNADLSAYDAMQEQSLCINCHSSAPHTNTMYNHHTAKISCTTCHATSKGGVTYKDFSVTTCPSGDCSPESLNTYGVALTAFPEDFAITYAWFDGTVETPIHPRGNADNGVLHPYKVGYFNQPVDVENNPIPLKWGKLFVAGDMQAAIASGRSLYASYLDNFQGDPAMYGLPAVPGEFDHFNEVNDTFSLSHGITKTGALTCIQCHDTEQSVLNWDALGIANPNPM